MSKGLRISGNVLIVFSIISSLLYIPSIHMLGYMYFIQEWLDLLPHVTVAIDCFFYGLILNAAATIIDYLNELLHRKGNIEEVKNIAIDIKPEEESAVKAELDIEQT